MRPPSSAGRPLCAACALQRYAGDGVLHGSAELNVPLTKAFLFVPGELGLLGLFDVGRVYVERSRRWHRGAAVGSTSARPSATTSPA